MASHGLYSPHLFEKSLLEIVVHIVEVHLVLGLVFVNGFDDFLAASALKKLERRHNLFQVDLNVAQLEVVVVHDDRAFYHSVGGINEPDGLPFTAPERGEFEVDAGDLDAKFAVLEKDIRAGRVGLKLS
jgi:hypothetical protein